MTENDVARELPQINADRPKMTLRRLDKWSVGRAYSDEQFIQYRRLRSSIEEYAINKGTMAQAKSMENVNVQIEKLKALL
jgi:hypothetical protein